MKKRKKKKNFHLSPFDRCILLIFISITPTFSTAKTASFAAIRQCTAGQYSVHIAWRIESPSHSRCSCLDAWVRQPRHTMTSWAPTTHCKGEGGFIHALLYASTSHLPAAQRNADQNTTLVIWLKKKTSIGVITMIKNRQTKRPNKTNNQKVSVKRPLPPKFGWDPSGVTARTGTEENWM